MEGLLLLVKALHTSILFILMCFACFSRLVQVVMKTALTVTLIIMMIVTRIPLVQVRVVAEVVELEVVVPEPKELYYLLQLLMRDTETHDKLCNKCFYMPSRAYFERKIVVFRICHLFEVKGQP